MRTAGLTPSMYRMEVFKTFPDANRPMTHQGLAQMGPNYQIGDERMMRSTNNPWNNVHPHNMQWPQIPQGINREQSQDSLHPFQIPPQNMGQMNPKNGSTTKFHSGNPTHTNGVSSLRAQPTPQEMSQTLVSEWSPSSIWTSKTLLSILRKPMEPLTRQVRMLLVIDQHLLFQTVDNSMEHLRVIVRVVLVLILHLPL